MGPKYPNQILKKIAYSKVNNATSHYEVWTAL